MVLDPSNRLPGENDDEGCGGGDESELKRELPASLGSFSLTDIEPDRALVQVELEPETGAEDLLCCWGSHDDHISGAESDLLPASEFEEGLAHFELEDLQPDRDYWLTLGRDLEVDVTPPTPEEAFFTGERGDNSYTFVVSLVSPEGREAVLSGHFITVGGAAEELNADNFITVSWTEPEPGDLEQVISYNLYIMPEDRPLIYRHSVSGANSFIYTGQKAEAEMSEEEYIAWLVGADHSITLARESSEKLHFRSASG